MSKLKTDIVKNTIKSFVRENNFHTYLTRETLPAEKRVSEFHNHLLMPQRGRLCQNPTEVT